MNEQQRPSNPLSKQSLHQLACDVLRIHGIDISDQIEELLDSAEPVRVVASNCVDEKHSDCEGFVGLPNVACDCSCHLITAHEPKVVPHDHKWEHVGQGAWICTVCGIDRSKTRLAEPPAVIPDATRKLGELAAAHVVMRLALQKIVTDGDFSAPEGMKRTARDALKATESAAALGAAEPPVVDRLKKAEELLRECIDDADLCEYAPMLGTEIYDFLHSTETKQSEPPETAPPFTVEQYGSVLAAITAERDWLRWDHENLKKQLERFDDEPPETGIDAAIEATREVKLPCDVRVGAGTVKSGVAVSTLLMMIRNHIGYAQRPDYPFKDGYLDSKPTVSKWHGCSRCYGSGYDVTGAACPCGCRPSVTKGEAL